METKHTSLPWVVSGGDIWPVTGNPRVKIASTIKPSPMNGIDWLANAQFIVRACNSHNELVTALEALLSETDRLDGFDCDVNHPCDETIERAVAAITKARGDV